MPTPRGIDALILDLPVCLPPVHERFREVYDAEGEQLGCPAAPPIGHLNARQSYEKGSMFWRQDTARIYVLYESGGWQAFPDTWDEDQPVFSCTEAKMGAPPKPQRGFGKVWCNESGVREGLGRATTEEVASKGNVQDFRTGGAILLTDAGETFVLYPTGHWTQR